MLADSPEEQRGGVAGACIVQRFLGKGKDKK